MVDLAEVFTSPTTLDLSVPLGHSCGKTIMVNVAISDKSDRQGWFTLHHVGIE